MSFPRIILLACAALVVTLAGCKINTINSFPSRPASVRFISFMPDAPPVTVNGGGSQTWTNVPFATPTDYVQFENRQTAFDIFVPDQENSITGASASLSANLAYTLLGYGVVADPHAVMQTDSYTTLNPGNAQYRLTHMAVGAGGVEVFLTLPDVDITNENSQYGLGLASTTSFQRVDAVTQRLRLTRGGSTTVLMFDSGPLDFPDLSTEAYYLYTRDGTHAVNVLRVDVVNGTSVEIPNKVAAVKFVNAAYQAGGLDSLWDGTVGVSNIIYPGAADTYYSVTAGIEHVMAFQPNASPGTIVASAPETFTASTDSTLLLSGANGSLTITVLPDHNLPPPPGTTRVRFINASPEIAAFDVYLDDVLKASNIAYTKTTDYFDITPDNHKLAFMVPGTQTPYISYDSKQFGSGEVNSFYLSGPTSDLQGISTQDNR